MRKVLPLSLLVALMLFGTSAGSAQASVITYTNQVEFRTDANNPTLQSFENSPVGNNAFPPTLTNLNTPGMTVTSTTPGVTFGVYNSKDVSGAHATEGDNHIVTSGSDGIAQTYTINFHFSAPITSFGINVTDFGDVAYGASLLMGVTFVGGTGQAFTIDTVNGAPNANGNQLFFGIISNDQKFTDIQLVVTRDPIGFDEVYFADSNVPEPSTLALGAIGLIGLSFWRRNKRLSA